MKYNCVLLVAAHSDAGTEIKDLESIKQTTITSSPGICNAGSESHFMRLLEPYQGTDLDINEEELCERFKAIKTTMHLDTSTPSKSERIRLFLEDPGFISEPLIRQYREKAYHFYEGDSQVGCLKIIIEGSGIIDITDKVLEIKGSRVLTKTDIFDFLDGGGFKQVLFLDMSCNLTENAELSESIRRDKIVGGKKKSRKRIKTKRRKRI